MGWPMAQCRPAQGLPTRSTPGWPGLQGPRPQPPTPAPLCLCPTHSCGGRQRPLAGAGADPVPHQHLFKGLSVLSAQREEMWQSWGLLWDLGVGPSLMSLFRGTPLIREEGEE